jgi:hypothetical protein
LRQAGAAAIAYALLVVSAGLGLAWLGVALDRWLIVATPGWSALVITFLFLVPPVCAAVAYWLSRRRKARLAREQAVQSHAAQRLLSNRAQGLLRNRPLAALGATVLGGLFLAKFPGAAAVLSRFLQPSDD